ncbi:hypothetical protein QTP70_016643 [Hemibagrus guttatus]|uniref:Uncharacterized protein n=1 Tax=Hemibagrus guttatus TaxID=175788 RepID=A0AAE0RE74_9TELE|nr:hypothetical protein QTP70_016643 [Hemibagrus guttatus]
MLKLKNGHSEAGAYPSNNACKACEFIPDGMQDTPWTECQPIAGHTHIHSHSLTQSHTTDNLEMPINLPCMSLDWGRKPEYPEETPGALGEHANSTYTWRRRGSNPQPWRCEANVLATLHMAGEKPTTEPPMP